MAADREQARLTGLNGDAWDEQWQRWREAAATVQTAVTEYAKAAGGGRHDVESAVKKAARHPAPDRG